MSDVRCRNNLQKPTPPSVLIGSSSNFSQILPWVVPPKSICQILDISIWGFLGNFLGGFWLDYQKAYSSLNFDRIFFKLLQILPWAVPPKSVCQIFDIWIFGEFLTVLGGIWLDHQKAYSSLSFDRISLKLSQNVPGMIPQKVYSRFVIFSFFAPPP